MLDNESYTLGCKLDDAVGEAVSEFAKGFCDLVNETSDSHIQSVRDKLFTELGIKILIHHAARFIVLNYTAKYEDESEDKFNHRMDSVSLKCVYTLGEDIKKLIKLRKEEMKEEKE